LAEGLASETEKKTPPDLRRFQGQWGFVSTRDKAQAKSPQPEIANEIFAP
jgi:hypothetical protein